MSFKSYVPIVCFLGAIGGLPFSASAAEPAKSKSLPPIPLSVEEIQAWIDRSHPLLKGAGTEKVMARGKMLKALGAFEPNVVNDTVKVELQPAPGATVTHWLLVAPTIEPLPAIVQAYAV